MATAQQQKIKKKLELFVVVDRLISTRGTKIAKHAYHYNIFRNEI